VQADRDLFQDQLEVLHQVVEEVAVLFYYVVAQFY
jgi:hypothetical protein